MFIIIYDNNLRIKKNITSDYKYKGIHITKSDVNYYFRFDYPYYIELDNKIECRKYLIKNYEDLNDITIYVYENDDGINEFFTYKKDNFILNSGFSADIITSDSYLEKGYLNYRNGYIETDYENVLVNGNKYNGNLIKNGDELSLNGLEIYFYDEFLYINNFRNQIKINKCKLEGKDYIFKDNKPKILNYYKSDNEEIKIGELKPFKAPNKNNDKNIIFQIGPSITMAMAMGFIAFINIYNSYISNGFSISLISIAIMPLTIMLSGILWPILSRRSENKKYKIAYQKAKDKYLEYLKDYESETIDKLKRYKDNENYYRFKQEDIKERLFYINSLSKRFMNINIGSFTRSFEFNYELTGDEDIDNYLISLKNKIANIGDVPLYVDLKDKKKISIVSNDYKNLFKKILLELSYKYSNDDLLLAVYFSDDEVFESIYALPHLFYLKNRLIFKSDGELNLLSTISSKPIVLLTDKEVNLNEDNLSIIKFVKNQNQILSKSDAVIEDNGVISYYDSNDSKQLFSIDNPKIDYDKYFNYICKVDNEYSFKKDIKFSNSDIGLDIKNNYLKHDHGLIARFAYSDDCLLDFDLHESKDGPHGLVGGSTGSGKSELLISLLLSLALRYPPDYLNFILIDYKGGGIKESLSYNGKPIPHIIASIDNLEGESILRLLVVIKEELKSRELLFKKISKQSHLSIMSIDEYLNINEDYSYPKMAHLVILVDEFAELKKQNSELIKELISFSRIGRSLGVHLILATQKPNGVIDDEIWSNSHFKLALKVHDEKDSKEIIRSNLAAYLNEAGEFYLSVDTSLRKAKSIYAKQDINNNGKYEIGILDNRLNYSYKRVIKNTKGEYESSYICHDILKACNELNISTNNLIFKRPEPKTVEELSLNSQDQIVFGEKDDYLKLERGILSFNCNSNILIYSTRRLEINNIIYQFCALKRQMIIIGDKKYENKLIGDLISYDNNEDLNYLFQKLLKDTKSKITIIIENLNILLSYDEKYLDILLKLIKRSKLSNYNLVVFVDNSVINYKLLNSFNNKVLIDINDKQELTNFFGSKGKYEGESFYFDDEPIPFVETKIKESVQSERLVNPYIEKIPEIIVNETVNEEALIGYFKISRNKYYLKKDESLLITGFNQDMLKKCRRIFNKLNISIMSYDNKLCLNNYRLILWVGEGIYNQRLFYTDKNIDLLPDEGYLYQDGKGEVLKLVNYEPNNNSFFHHV